MPERTSRARRAPSGPRPKPTVTIRRALAALSVMAAAWLGLTALTPSDQPSGSPVLVLTRDIDPGTTLTSADVELTPRPSETQPAGSLDDLDAAVGAVASHPLRQGAILTNVDLGFADWLTNGQVAISVPVANALMLAATPPGSHVDVWAPTSSTALTTDALVLSQSQPPEDPTLLIAVDAGDTAKLAAAAGAVEGVSIVLRSAD